MHHPEPSTPADKHPAINIIISLVFLILLAFSAFAFNSLFAKEWLLYPAALSALFMAYIAYWSKTPKMAMLGLVGTAITGLAIHLLSHKGLQGSALFYIGLPLLLAYAFKEEKSPKRSATGSILKGITLVLLLSGPILQEGFICVIMAAPIFYIIGGIFGSTIDAVHKKKMSKLQASPFILLVMLMSLEGTHPVLTFDRNHTVRVEKVITATPEAIEKQLNRPLVLGDDLPHYLKLFPFPSVKHFQGTELGDKTTLNFVYYLHFYFKPKIGDLTYNVTQRGDNFIESSVASDNSYVSTYMDWKKSKVSWDVIDDLHTKVTWEISYERKLDPAWYFGTLEYFTTSLMAEALIKYAATPEFARDS